MTKIRVVHKRFPKKGRFINQGAYDYFTTPDGLPAFAFRWQGMLLSGSKAQFIFARDVVRISRIPDDVARSQARAAGFSRGSGVPGLIPSLIGGAIGAATAKTSDIKGFGVIYQNEDGHSAAFFAVASPEIVDEILSSVPAEKHEVESPSSDEA
jgi:hypothetical protein